MAKFIGNMNVVFDNIVFSLQRAGGISVVWRELLQRALTDARLDLNVIEYPADNLQRNELNIPQNLVIHPAMRFMERYREPQFQPQKTCIFHSSYFRVLRNSMVKNVTTIHDLTYHYYRYGLPKAVHLAQEKFALQHSKAVICVSEATKQDLMRFYPFLKEDIIRVVYNGVSPLYNSCISSNISKFEAGGYLLYVGTRDTDYKNFGVAVEVARMTHLPLVLAGPPLLSVESRLLDDLLGCGNWENFSRVGTHQLHLLYGNAFALLYPSAYEGFGLPVVEAQACGCVPIIQNSSSLPEVAGEGAVIVEAEANLQKLAYSMADCVNALRNGTVDKSLLVAAGLVNCQRFSWDKSYERIIKLYQELTNNA
jgi:mannosyltransferase